MIILMIGVVDLCHDFQSDARSLCKSDLPQRVDIVGFALGFGPSQPSDVCDGSDPQHGRRQPQQDPPLHAYASPTIGWKTPSSVRKTAQTPGSIASATTMFPVSDK